MPEQGFYLEQSDVEALRWVIDWVKSFRKETPAPRLQQLPVAQMYLAKAYDTVAPGGHGLFKTWKGAAGDEEETDQQYDAYDWLGGGITSGEPAYLFKVKTSDHKLYFISAAATRTRWKNTDSDTCPAYGGIEIYGADTDAQGDFLLGRKPRQDASDGGGFFYAARRGNIYYFNLDESVAQFDSGEQNFGYLSTTFPARAAWNDSFPGVDEPSAGEVWGLNYLTGWKLSSGVAGSVVSGDYDRRRDFGGFRILGGIDDSDEDNKTVLIAPPVFDNWGSWSNTTGSPLTGDGSDSVPLPLSTGYADFNYDETNCSIIAKNYGHYQVTAFITAEDYSSGSIAWNLQFGVHVKFAGAGSWASVRATTFSSDARCDIPMWGTSTSITTAGGSYTPPLKNNGTITFLWEAGPGDEIAFGLKFTTGYEVKCTYGVNLRSVN